MTDPTSPSTASIAIATAILSLAAGYFLGTASSLGLFSSPPPSSSSRKASQPKTSWPNSYDVKIHPDSSDEEVMNSLGRNPKSKEIKDSEDEGSSTSSDSSEEDEVMGELSTFAGNTEESKLVLVVRTDLGMGKGNRPATPLPSPLSRSYDLPRLLSIEQWLTPPPPGKIAAQASHAALACYTSFPPSPTPHPLLRRWQQQGQAKIAVQVPSEDELLELQARALSLGLCAKVVRDAGRTQIAAGSATVLGVGPGPKSVIDGVTGGLKLL